MTDLACTRGRRPCARDNMGMDYIGTDLRGIVSGGNQNACAIYQSAYQSGAFENIFHFDIVYEGGQEQPVYCLEKGVRGAQGSPYQSAPVSQCMGQLTRDQMAGINHVLANAYPAISMEEMFVCAGVNPKAAPELTNEDAYAAVQVAIWSIIDRPENTEEGWRFYDCVSGALHPKSARLKQTVESLYRAAQQDAMRPQPPVALGAGCRCVQVSDAVLADCGPGEMREVCGKVLYGPLMVRAPRAFELAIEPLCPSWRPNGFITFVDGCGRAIESPASGQEFYLSFPRGTPASCYRLTMTVPRTVVTVAVLCNTDAPPRLQAVAAVPEQSTQQVSGSICLCFAPPCAQCKKCEPVKVCAEVTLRGDRPISPIEHCHPAPDHVQQCEGPCNPIALICHQ